MLVKSRLGGTGKPESLPVPTSRAEMTPDPFLVGSGHNGHLESGLLLVGVGHPAGDAGARAGQAERGGGAVVVAVDLSAALAGNDRLCADRAALSAQAASRAAGAAFGVDPGGT